MLYCWLGLKLTYSNRWIRRGSDGYIIKRCQNLQNYTTELYVSGAYYYYEMKVHKISAVTLIIKNMERSCNFYSQIPGFKLVYGGSCDDTFTTYEIGEDVPKMCLNLELSITNNCITEIIMREKYNILEE